MDMMNLKMQALPSNSVRFMPLYKTDTELAKLSVIMLEVAGFLPTNNSLTEPALRIYHAAYGL